MGERTGFDFTNPGGTGGKWNTRLCFGCDDVGVVGGGSGWTP